MRITHIIPVMDPATGGPPAVVAAVTSILRTKGHDARIVCYETPDANERIAGLMTSATAYEQVPMEYLPTLSRAEVYLSSHAKRLLPQKLTGADVVHLHGIWDPITRVAGNVCRHLQIPYVISTHGMLEPWAINQKRWKKELFWRLGWGDLLQNAAAIHDYRPGPIHLLRRQLTPTVWEIPNGIFPTRVPTRDETAPAWESLCGRFPTLRNKRVILFLARLSVQKGPDLLVDASIRLRAQHPDHVVLLAGADYGANLGDLPPHVIRTGPLFGEEKDAALAWSDLYCLPSRHEGFSVSVLEAMNAALPCVITEACHFPRAQEAGAAIIAQTPSHADHGGWLHTALHEMLSNPNRAGMGRRGRELVRREYTWPALVPKYEEMYNSLKRESP